MSVNILSQNILIGNIITKNIHYYFDVESRNIIGSRVQQIRKAARPLITQKELVARLQVLGLMIDQSGLSKIENGQRPVSDIEVVAFAKALRISPLSLLQEDENSPLAGADKGKAMESEAGA